MPSYIALDFNDVYMTNLHSDPKDALQEFEDNFGAVDAHMVKLYEINGEIPFETSRSFSTGTIKPL